MTTTAGRTSLCLCSQLALSTPRALAAVLRSLRGGKVWSRVTRMYSASGCRVGVPTGAPASVPACD